MRKGFFARLAVVSIRKNKQIYVPYILACLFNVAYTVYDAFYQS